MQVFHTSVPEMPQRPCHWNSLSPLQFGLWTADWRVQLQLIHPVTEGSKLATLLRNCKLEMWTNVQRDGRPAEYRWRPLFNAAKFA